ncbi:outer membrane protein assembly factor BamB family protein [Massilia rhizosphaerae]|uniref:outer membrane protein assembly factor BamB family protein n=1 Tax=Massilia rhizosphaerae TaxID=2784389 RepID=UPI0018DDEBD2|nr:PQQ-binding-like beta-propeller repeat protein [Massilia rhizosphaerae]
MRLIALLFVFLSAAAHAADWPMFTGGPAHAGRVAGVAGGIRAFRLAGRFDVHAAIHASPVAAQGRVFVGAENGNLYALDAASHALLWLYHARGGIASTPAVADGTVYFLDRAGSVQALGAADGVPVWSFRTQGEAVFAAHGMFGLPRDGHPVLDPWDFYLSSPLVHDGMVYVGSSDGCVYALDAKDGKLAWAWHTGGMVHSSPALAGGNIVVGSWDGAVYALDARTGELRWRHQTGVEQKVSINLGIQASPAVDGDTVYVGSRDGFFYALDAASGRSKWRYDAKGSWIVGTPAVDGDNVYVGTSDTGLLLALDKRSGRERYRFETKVWTFASPLRVGDVVVAASMKGELHALDAATGRARWSWRSPALLANEAGVVDPATGKFDNDRMFKGGAYALYAGLEHVKRLGAFIASPAWYDGRLIVAGATGEVLFFEPLR